MKYMQTGGFQNHPFMRLTLNLTLLFVIGLWVTNFAMYFNRMGLTPSSVSAYYLGSEADFTAPRSFASMLEVTHVHLPIIGIIVLMLTHLLIFAPFKDSTKYAFITTAFLSALLNEAAGWLVRFFHPSFAWLKILAFITFQAMLGFLILSLALFLWRAKPRRAKKARR